MSYLAAHILLRELLSRRLAVPAERIELTRERCPCCGSANGRPALAVPRAGVHFSLSRRSGLVLVGLAAKLVGVDVEMHSSGAAFSEVAPLLHPYERSELESLPVGQRDREFSRLWARKEAWLKARGTGIAHGLAAGPLGTGERDPDGWVILDVDLGTQYAAAAAVAL